MRFRFICTFATTILLLAGLATSAEAKHRHHGGTGTADVGGAEAPALSTGPTGTTGQTGTSGATGSTTPAVDLAPITLPKDASPTAVYNGPVYEETAGGLVPYAPALSNAPSTTSSVAGGTTAATSSVAPAASSSLPELVVPGDTAEEVKVDGLGLAAAPEDAPLVVQEVIWNANKIIGRPYVYGGGHRSFISFGYDCSGTVSFALHGGGLLNAPLDSGQFERWGGAGQGQWMTILTNPGHAYLDVAGLRLDTSPANDPSNLEGPRWRPLRPGNPGFVERHPFGY